MELLETEECSSKFINATMINGVREEKIATMLYIQPPTTIRKPKARATTFMKVNNLMRGKKNKEKKAKQEQPMKDREDEIFGCSEKRLR